MVTVSVHFTASLLQYQYYVLDCNGTAVQNVLQYAQVCSDVRDFVRRLQQLYEQCAQEQQYFLMLIKFKLKGAAGDLIEGDKVNDFQNYVDRLIFLFSPDNKNVVKSKYEGLPIEKTIGSCYLESLKYYKPH